MDSVFDKACFISSQLNKDLILYKDPVIDHIHLFIFQEFNHKTTNTPYHEFVGFDITDELHKINISTWDTNSFLIRIEKKPLTTLRSSKNNWIWIKVNNY